MQPILNLKRNKKIGTPSGIKSLILDLEKSALVLRSSSPRKFFLQFLKEFRDLESLKITSISFKNSPILMKALRNFRGLKDLEVTFTRVAARYYRGDYLQDFISVLYKSCPRLAQLRLNFQDDLPITTWREDYFGSPLKIWRLKRLSNLQRLTIHFPISTFMGEKKILRGNLRSTIKYMDLSAMKRFNRLKALDLALIQQPGDEYLQLNTTELCFDPNKLFPNVKRFTWCVISSRAMKVKELDIIGPQIASQLKCLDDFGLGFRQDHAKAIRNLSQCLVTLNRDLNRLFFVYTCEELAVQDANAFIYELSLKSLGKLSTLSLEFKSCKRIKNGFLVDLAQAISQNLAELRSLRLCFESEKQRPRSVWMAVKATFGCREISDQGIKQFADILSKGCENLEFVSLEFERYSEISDKGVESLCQKLDRLKRLKVVWVRFCDCMGVTEMGCEEAAKLLETADRKVMFRV